MIGVIHTARFIVLLCHMCRHVRVCQENSGFQLLHTAK
jgi:hypothetical protein